MKLAVSSVSFAAALAVMVPKYSNAAMASAVDAAYENKVVEAADVKTRSLGEECSFASSGLRGNDADTGILSCGMDFVCVEDGRSSLGGICVSADTKHRKLQTHTPTTSCATKCTGTDACKGTDAAIIATIPDGSCCGELACAYLTGSISIGAGSCLGAYSCYKAYDATIGNGSCTGDKVKGPDITSTYAPYYGFSCANLKGTVGDNSCYEYSACYQSYKGNSGGYQFGETFNVGDGSCKGPYTTCAYSGDLTIGDDSCNGDYSCYKMTGNVGNGSCKADSGCYEQTGGVFDGVCNTAKECYKSGTAKSLAPTKAPTTSPSKSPTTSPSVSPTTSSAPSSAPTSNPTVSPTTSTMPSGAPTDSPTTSPTASPTTSPSSSPTTSPTNSPTTSPTASPSVSPTTMSPTTSPTASPSVSPTTMSPTPKPTINTSSPTMAKSTKQAKDGKGGTKSVKSTKKI